MLYYLSPITIPMKKTLSLLSILALCFSVLPVSAQYADDTEFTTALDWMHTQWLTKYDTVDGFRTWDELTRQEAAKFFSSVLAFTIMPSDMEKTAFDCDFDDADTFDSTLTDSILLACTSWLMRGYDGKFHPNNILKKSEALTILIRMNLWLQDETWSPWWSQYYAMAYNQWLTKEQDTAKIDLPVSRYEAALLLSRQYWWGIPLDDQPITTIEELEQTITENEIKNTLRSNYLRTE